VATSAGENFVGIVVSGSAELELALLMLRALILWARVGGAILSLAAAPEGPETLLLLSANAASIISRSLRGSPLEGTTV